MRASPASDDSSTPPAAPRESGSPALRGEIPSAGVARVRVRYDECDPMGVAHHAAYVPWLEIARTELLRGTGVTYADLERSGVFLVVTRLECRYRRPARYDDVIDVRVRVTGAGRVHIDHEYELVLASSGNGDSRRAGDRLTTAATTLVCVGRDGRPAALPDWLAGESPRRPQAEAGAAASPHSIRTMSEIRTR